MMRMAGGIVWADSRLHKLSKGRVSLVAIAGLPALRLTTLGRKSGLPRARNLLYYPHGDEYVVTGSNWGRLRDPDWTFNLRAHPHATVSVRGRQREVHARELKGQEYERMWRRLVRFWPGYAMEREEAGRELPVFLLTPRER